MRFLADMGISPRVAEWLRGKGHNVVHAMERGWSRSEDVFLFERACEEHRILLTFDLDFGEIVAFSGTSFPGVIVFRLRNTRAPNVIKRLDYLLNDALGGLKEGAVVVVEEARYRVRYLPVGT